MLTLGKQVDAFLIQLEMILMLFLRAQMACKVDTWPLNTVVVAAHSQASIMHFHCQTTPPTLTTTVMVCKKPKPSVQYVNSFFT